MDGGVIILIVGVLLIGGIVAASYAAAARRRRRYEEFAQQRGWRYEPQVRGLDQRFPQLTPFGQGSSRTCSDVFRYRVGQHQGYSFEYSYTESSGTGQNRTSTTYTHHVVSLDLPQPLPRITLRPEGFFDALAKKFGAQDIEFESAEFNRAWLVKSEYLAAAHDVIHPRMMDWLMTPAHQEMNFTIQDGTLYTYVETSQEIKQIDPLISLLVGFVAQVPAFVWEKAQGEYPRRERGGGFFGLFGS